MGMEYMTFLMSGCLPSKLIMGPAEFSPDV